MKGKVFRKAIAASLALMMVSGTLTIQPFSDMLGNTAITANAAGTEFSGGDGTQFNPYVISGENDWNTLVSQVKSGNSYSEKYFILDGDISVSQMVGTASNRFEGVFNGCGYTLTVNLTNNATYTAPFRYVKNAVIKNLHTAGTITTSAKFASGIIGNADGTVNLSSCRSSVTIISSVSGDGTSGGLTATANGGCTLNFDNCLFDGKMLTTNSTTFCGGFVGWTEIPVNANNCLYAPAEIADGETEVLVGDGTQGCTFARVRNNQTNNLTNCYYTRTLAEAQGTDGSQMTAEELVEALGSGWQSVDGKAVPLMFKSIGVKNAVFDSSKHNTTDVTDQMKKNDPYATNGDKWATMFTAPEVFIHAGEYKQSEGYHWPKIYVEDPNGNGWSNTDRGFAFTGAYQVAGMNVGKGAKNAVAQLGCNKDDGIVRLSIINPGNGALYTEGAAPSFRVYVDNKLVVSQKT